MDQPEPPWRFTLFNRQCSTPNSDLQSREMLPSLYRSVHRSLTHWPSKLIVFVIMPDHFHLIVNPRDGNIQGFAGALKSLLAARIIEITNDNRFKLKTPDKDSIHQVWQDSFKAMPLWSLWMIWQKINYIHANPVRARLVKSAKDYPWTSFRAFYSDSK